MIGLSLPARSASNRKLWFSGLSFAISVVAIVAYFIGRTYWTIGPPPGRLEEGVRYQIGFHLAPWSLTSEAADKLDSLSVASRTPGDLMLAFGAYKDGGPQLIWKPWTIVVAGSMLVALYLVAFLFWAFAVSMLARHIAKKGY
jgi:hypothetical protein